MSLAMARQGAKVIRAALGKTTSTRCFRSGGGGSRHLLTVWATPTRWSLMTQIDVRESESLNASRERPLELVAEPGLAPMYDTLMS